MVPHARVSIDEEDDGSGDGSRLTGGESGKGLRRAAAGARTLVAGIVPEAR
jgi:hypothetical protein